MFLMIKGAIDKEDRDHKPLDPLTTKKQRFKKQIQEKHHEVRRRGQWASRGAPGKSGLHASGEGERVIAPEPW